jgi:integrase
VKQSSIVVEVQSRERVRNSGDATIGKCRLGETPDADRYTGGRVAIPFTALPRTANSTASSHGGLAQAANKAGVDADVNLYCARHTFGSDVMEATKNQFQLMTVMGHTTVRTTQRYQHHETAGVGKLLEETRNLRTTQFLRHSGQNGLKIVS